VNLLVVNVYLKCLLAGKILLWSRGFFNLVLTGREKKVMYGDHIRGGTSEMGDFGNFGSHIGLVAFPS